MELLEKDLKELFSEQCLQAKIKELAENLNKHYGGEEIYIVCVLKGSVMFTVDLVKHLKNACKNGIYKTFQLRFVNDDIRKSKGSRHFTSRFERKKRSYR